MLMSAHTGKPGADSVYETRWLCNKPCERAKKRNKVSLRFVTAPVVVLSSLKLIARLKMIL